MNPPARLSERVRLGAFELNVQTGELVSLQPSPDGSPPERILLREQSFQILRMLVERQGRIVTRREIRNILWPNDTIVDFDRSINVAIAALRKALADDADNPKYIETLARRGYRLIAPVEWQQSSSGDPLARDSSGPQVVTRASISDSGLVGKRVSRYRVLAILGGGGMGVVYKAEDLKLGRCVALKFLPEELSEEPKALQRFELEAQAASVLNHPNICTIYGTEEFENRPFIVMELLEGDALSTRLAQSPGPLLLATILDIAIQICDGLQAAHAKGIIHRDIKPANIFLTKQGAVKILDFGLAKLTAAEEEPESSPGEGKSGATEPSPQEEAPNPLVDYPLNLTLTGTALGTTGYMSPEQIRKEKLDPRTDLFSFGLVLYEMATGRRAFEGQTAAIVQDAILCRAPASVRELSASLPRSLEAVIVRAIEKDRGHRYQSASEIHGDLLRIQKEVAPRRRILRYSFAAAALLSLLALGAWTYWRVRNTVTLSPTDSIVFAEIENQTADAALSDGMDLAWQIALFQSPYLNLLGSDKVHEALSLLRLPEDTNVTVSPELARLVCQRTNSRAIISGSIADLGNHYGIELKAINCRTGRIYERVNNEAETRGDLVRVLGVAAAQLRGKLGEPRDSLAKFNQPLELATSSSPDALHFLASAYKSHLHWDLNSALADYHRALEKDENLALAYAGAASAYGALGDEARLRSAAARAFQLREPLTAPSRFQVETFYYGDALGAWEKELSVAEPWVRTYPHDVIARINLATAFANLGRPEDALIHAREAARLLPSVPTFRHLFGAAIEAGHLDEARAAYEDIKARQLDAPRMHALGVILAFLRNDQPALEAEWVWAAQHPDMARDVIFHQARIAAYHGQFRESLRLTRQIADAAKKSGNPLEAAGYEYDEALRQAEGGNYAESQRLALQAPQKGGDHGSRSYAPLVFARNGNLAAARKRADELDRLYPQDLLSQEFCLPVIHAAMKLRQNDPAGAIEILRLTAPYELAFNFGFDNLYPAYIRGLAYLQLKQGNSAAREFQKLLDHPGVVGGFVTGALAHLQLARAQAMAGDLAAARKSYEDFLALWKDGDSDLPVYKQAKAEYARLAASPAN